MVGHHSRRGAAEDDRGAGDPTELERHIDRVIARIALLFIGGLLFLVDDHQADAFERREKSRTRTDHDVGGAIEDTPPFVETLAC